ncbi:MAG TPA: hypothetical protein VNJ70_17470 [Thermoanaerobaculia bacterium]|nr:hypothetical protein [Thermoanaerobaculia bacterium]
MTAPDGENFQEIPILSFLDRYRDLAPLLLRVFVGFVLIYGTATTCSAPRACWSSGIS